MVPARAYCPIGLQKYPAFTLKMISSRRTQLWPTELSHACLVDHFRACFRSKSPPKGNGVAAS